MQTRLQSFFESLANVALGYLVALGAQLLVFPWFGIVIPMSSNILIGIIFTLVSLVRSYFLRRLFNLLHHETHPQRRNQDIPQSPTKTV